jgi:Probable cobalt transporter subunit (CbtB)
MGNAVVSSQAMMASTRPVDLSAASAALWLAATTLLALLVIYFVGIDQGAVSVFGGDMHVHEFTHDARHLLGFPCH